MTLTLGHFLVLSALLAGMGILTIALRRHALGILMGIELIMAAATLNFVAFNACLPAPPGTVRHDGQVMALFVIVAGAAQAAVIVALYLNLHAKHPPGEALRPARGRSA